MKICFVTSTMKCELGWNMVDCVWNVMAHAQKPDLVFRRNGQVHLNRRGHQFSRLLAAGVCASALVMLDTPCSEVVWRILATHSIRQFPLHFHYLRHRVPSHFNWTLQKPLSCDFKTHSNRNSETQPRFLLEKRNKHKRTPLSSINGYWRHHLTIFALQQT